MVQAQLHTIVRHLHRVAGEADLAGLTDRQLLERFVAARDEDAFAAVVRRHGGLVLGVCWRVLRHADDVEDAFQATFLVLARRAGAVPWRDSAGNWPHEAAPRVACRARAERARRQTQERRGAMTDPGVRPEAAWGEVGAVLDEELRRLPAGYREPLLLCYLEGQTRDQAARRLGWSPRTLKRRLAAGLALLRARLTRRGLSLSTALLVSALSENAARAAVPAALAESAARAAAGRAAPAAAALAEGVLHGLAAGKWKAGLGLVAVLGLLVGGTGLVARQEPKAPEA